MKKLIRRPVSFIGAALGWGAANKPEAELGPKAIEAAGIQHRLNWPEMRRIETTISACVGEKRDYAGRLVLIRDFCLALAKEVEAAIQAQQLPVVVGGDHAVAIGTWPGVKAGLGGKRLGLLWVDAHLDAHTPETTPSNNVHGMPLAALLGYGEPSLVNLLQCGQSPIFLPEDVVLVGIRSAEAGEIALIQSLGIRVFSMSDIEERGLSEVMAEATSILTEKTDAFGITVDVDAFDPRFAPGTGTPEVNGLIPEIFLPFLAELIEHPAFRAFELAEFNPVRDEGNRTLKLVEHILSLLV